MQETNNETDKALRSIRRSIDNLNKQIEIVRKQYPDANYYMTCNTMNVLDSESHIDGDIRNYDVEILYSDTIRYSDCGDW